MTYQHTQGPWVWEARYHGLSGKDNASVLFFAGDYEGMWVGDGPDGHANARLIAASPELLAFAESLVSAMDAPPKLRKALIEARLQNARQVISKARGVTG